jgi:hypothetical protein
MTIQSEHIAHKSTADSEVQIAAAIEPGGTDACLPGELVCERQAGSVYLHSLDANNSSERIIGYIKNENKGSITVSNNGEGPSSMVLNANSVTTAKIPDGTIQNSKISGTVSIAKGGTGKSTVPEAIKALLPIQSPTAALLHFDGTFSDSSLNNLPVTPNGSPLITTAQSKFGGTSAYFNNVDGTYLTVGSPNAVDIFDAPFTIEAWIYQLGYNTDQIIAMAGGPNVSVSPTGSHWIIRTNTSAQLSIHIANATGLSAFSIAGIGLNTWIHLGICWTGSQWYQFANGTTSLSSGQSAPVRPSTNATLTIGGSPLAAGYRFNGYIDEFRVTRGAALYTPISGTSGLYSLPIRASSNPTNRHLSLGTNGTSAQWQTTAFEFRDFDDVGSSVSTALSNQYLKWNSSTLEWAPTERASRTSDVAYRTQPGRDGELARDEDALLIATGTNQWQKVDLSTW